jgi:hypothetical protein
MCNDRKVKISGFASTIHCLVGLMDRPAHLCGSPLALCFKPFCAVPEVLYNQFGVYVIKLVFTIGFTDVITRPGIQPFVPGSDAVYVMVVKTASNFAGQNSQET